MAAASDAPSFPGLAAGLPLETLLQDPYPLYRMLRASNPVMKLPIPEEGGAGAWLLTRHAEVELALRDRRFSADRTRADVVHAYRDRLPAQLLEGPRGLRSMLMMDPPDHTRVRRLVSKAFTPRRVAALEPRIRELLTELLEEARADGRFDLIRDVAEPLPAIVIAELLGVPVEDHRKFKEWSSALIDAIGQTPFGGGTPDSFREKVDVILDYLAGIIAERRKAPADDLISGMIEAQEARDALSDQELLSTSMLLLLAGHETTTNLVGNGTLALLRNPEQLARLRGEPGLLAGAVEELLRYDSPVQATVRVVTEALELGGQDVAAGALVICGIGAANRDPDVFADPDRLDIGRSDVAHLSFGFGTHFCLGAALARLEGRLALEALLGACPALALADEGAPAYRPNAILRGLRSLPVAC